jgi:hypothetical protein
LVFLSLFVFPLLFRSYFALFLARVVSSLVYPNLLGIKGLVVVVVLPCCYVILICTTFLLQLSFQMWTNQMQDTLNLKKKGDNAFRQKDFTTAIDCYSQVAFSIFS